MPASLTRLNKVMLLLAILALLTGTGLVYPKNFTFHTPWIQAAYFFGFVFIAIVSMLVLFKRKYSRWWFSVYLGLIVLLLLVVHDAVTKSTFL